MKKPLGKLVGRIKSSRARPHIFPQRWVQVPTAEAVLIDPTFSPLQFLLTCHLGDPTAASPLNYSTVSCLPASYGSDQTCGRLYSEDSASSGCEEVLSNISLGQSCIFPVHQLGRPAYPTRPSVAMRLKMHRCRRNDPHVMVSVQNVSRGWWKNGNEQTCRSAGADVSASVLLSHPAGHWVDSGRFK